MLVEGRQRCFHQKLLVPQLSSGFPVKLSALLIQESAEARPLQVTGPTAGEELIHHEPGRLARASGFLVPSLRKLFDPGEEMGVLDILRIPMLCPTSSSAPAPCPAIPLSWGTKLLLTLHNHSLELETVLCQPPPPKASNDGANLIKRRGTRVK